MKTATVRMGLCGFLVAILLIGPAGSALGEISDSAKYVLDLTDPKDGPRKAKWSSPDQISITREGLGWGVPGDEGTRDFWLETSKPIGLGLSWRPPSEALIRVVIRQPGKDGLLYARYSPDGKCWSTWQPLSEVKPDKEGAVQEFRGKLRVPYRETEHYDKLRLEYARREDVPWASDEEALVTELLKGSPSFFEKGIPFIGYVQFLYEAQLEGGRRIRSLEAEVAWQISEKHHSPKDKKTRDGRDGPWRFLAR